MVTADNAFFKTEGHSSCMKISIDIRRSLNENAARYYDEAKIQREKAENAVKAIAETERELAELEKKMAQDNIHGPRIKVKRARAWYEKFRWFFSSDGFLVIAGRDAAQNDLIYSRHLEDRDLFFHADIQGAPATIIKNGVTAPEQTKQEAAQFAASYSTAWKVGTSAVDVYAVKKEQLSKHAQGGFVGRGAFGISGEREWFRGTALGLFVGVGESGLLVSPEAAGSERFSKKVLLRPGGFFEKGELAKKLARQLEADVDELNQLLPNGKTKLTSD